MKRTIAILVLCAPLGACGWQSTPCDPGGAEAARMALITTDLEFARVAREQGMAAAFAQYLAEDSMLLPMNFPTLYGPEDIATFFSMDPGLTVSWVPADAEIGQSCELGYTFGAWSVAGADLDGNPHDASGKYLGVWRRIEGRWRLSVYMQNMDPVTPEEPHSPTAENEQG